MDTKQKFYRLYNNLPLKLRDDVVLVVHDEPITWKVAKMEIDADTPLAKEILEKLSALDFI